MNCSDARDAVASGDVVQPAEAAAHPLSCAECRGFAAAERKVRDALALPPPSAEALLLLQKLRAPVLDRPSSARRMLFLLPAAVLVGAAATFLALPPSRVVGTGAPLTPPLAPRLSAQSPQTPAEPALFAELSFDGDDLEAASGDDFDLLEGEVSWSTDPDNEVDP